MRQWMVDPKVMCRQHLLGEHVEHHMFVGAMRRGKSVEGYLADGLLEPKSLEARHAALVEEMQRRGYNHKSPLLEAPLFGDVRDEASIDPKASLEELLRRCPNCAARYYGWEVA